MTRTRTPPLAVIVPIRSGSDPDVIEIDDCHEVYGDGFVVPDDLCSKSPDGLCHYTASFHKHRRCIHCGNDEGGQ